MKKQLKLFIIILSLIFNIFSFGKITLPQVAKATYVEGLITQDTVWTLAESPFVVSKDVIVVSGVTLAVEPGVDVRFGENASMIVEGRLTAVGEESKRIKFTSNKESPKAGDWHAIVFNSAAASTLTNCIVEYGVNGTIVEGGAISIVDSLVKDNSENGIMIVNGIVRIENSNVIDNNVNGICIAGGNNIVVQNNIIQSNGRGITLVGTLTSEIDIRQNNIILNKYSGISLNATALDNAAIVYNSISGNYYGFQVSSSTNTYITHNYISNNTIGISYAQGLNHEAHFNDIYANKIGMDVYLSDRIEVVDASFNYWGDRSGPYHESLNPHGKGNTVLGNGVNLDFIFFLTAPFDHVNTAPTPILWTDKTLVPRNQNITFIGTNSYDDGRVDQYFFDFDDGTNSGWTTLSLLAHSFTSVGTYNVALQVRDDFNVSSGWAFTVIQVQNLTSLETSLTLSDYTINHNGQVSVTVFVSDATSAVENATVTLFSVRGGSFAPQTGLTNATGYFTATFTAPNATEIINTRIIAKASKSGYADGSDFKYLEILPPFKVQIIMEPPIAKSEETAIATVCVTGAFEEPVADALVALSPSAGYITSPVRYTDVNGTATFAFTAPQTLAEMNVNITALVTKLGYAETQVQKTVTVEPRILVVEITAEPAAIESEATSTITVHVTYNQSPIVYAMATVSSDAGGHFSDTVGLTDSKGNAVFYFTAPQITIRINATISAIASETGYLDGKNQVVVTVAPKVLSVQAVARPSVTISEASINVTIHVGYNVGSIREAIVTITSGSFSTTGITNDYGNVTLVYVAPQVNVITEVTITARAAKTGFVEGISTTKILVQPGILNVTVTTDKDTVASTLSAVAVVQVTCEGNAVCNATVTMTASDGTFQNAIGMTDENGTCAFVYFAPSTSVQLSALIRANVTKNGYIAAGNDTTIMVNPEEAGGGGWELSLLTILLIAIPIVIVVAVVVLIKMKVIAISFNEGENE
jgi:hypothetical protein